MIDQPAFPLLAECKDCPHPDFCRQQNRCEVDALFATPAVGDLCQCPKCGRMHRNLGFGRPPGSHVPVTLAELEALLAEPDRPVEILLDGTVSPLVQPDTPEAGGEATSRIERTKAIRKEQQCSLQDAVRLERAEFLTAEIQSASSIEDLKMILLSIVNYRHST